jgi:divalent metal cation (Fe/Co/Zn/Cd) transporter
VLKLGLWGDILLTIGKGTAGYVSGSKAIIADAAHSLSDIVCFPYLLFLLFFCKTLVEELIHPHDFSSGNNPN